MKSFFDQEGGVILNINHLRYFEEVCRQGSITKAAEVCHISQPSITAAINGLEKELGYKIFYRANNRLHLTDEGISFKELTSKFLNDFSDYYTQACDVADSKKAVIRLGVPSVLGTFFFERIIPDFTDKHPYISLKIYEIATISGINMINNAELDILIGINNDTCYGNCESKEIFSTNLVLATGKDSPLASCEKVTTEMLDGLPMVVISKGSYHYDAIEFVFGNANLNIIMQSSQLSTIKDMVSNNIASTIIYKDVFENSEDICCIPLEKTIDARIHVFWQKNTYVSNAMKTFISYITQLEI